MIVNLFQHVGPSRPSSTSSSTRAGSRPPSVRRLALKDAETYQQQQKSRPFSARNPKTSALDSQERGVPYPWEHAGATHGGHALGTAHHEPRRGRPITARARLQADATRDTRIASSAAASDQDAEDKDANVPGSCVTLSRTPCLGTVTEESQSWTRKDEQQLQAHSPADGTDVGERVEYTATSSPLQRKGPKSPKQRRPGRRAGSTGMQRFRSTAADCSRSQAGAAPESPPRGWGPHGGAFPQHIFPFEDGDSLYPLHQRHGMPQLVDSLHAHEGASRAEHYSDELSAGEEVGSRGSGQNVYVRRKLPLKDEFRQMINDNKARSEALKRSAEAIESLTGALDANNAEKQLLVKVLMACAQQGAHTPREEARMGPVARRSQVAFICQILTVTSNERTVLESMPMSLLGALEDVMRLKMTYAEAVYIYKYIYIYIYIYIYMMPSRHSINLLSLP
jgi:hypothetical protein